VSAAEVIEQIKALSADEKARVIDFVTELQRVNSDIRYATDEEFNAAADEVFRKHSELLRRLAS